MEDVKLANGLLRWCEGKNLRVNKDPIVVKILINSQI